MKKRTRQKKNRWSPFGICMMLAFLLTTVSVCAAAVRSESTQSKEETIQEYISSLAKVTTVSSDKLGQGSYCVLPGMGTESSSLPNMSIEDAESSGVYSLNTARPSSVSSYYSDIAAQQHTFIVEQFGTNAWDNVSYTLEEVEPLYGTQGYRVIETGEIVSQSEYEALIREFWNEVAESEGVSYYDLFLADDEPVENMANKRTDLIAKYIDTLPAEMVLVSDSQTYDVFLAFNGEDTSVDGYSDFRFTIDNSNGTWVVYQGLNWTEPYPESPMAD